MDSSIPNGSVTASNTVSTTVLRALAVLLGSLVDTIPQNVPSSRTIQVSSTTLEIIANHWTVLRKRSPPERRKIFVNANEDQGPNSNWRASSVGKWPTFPCWIQ